MRNIVVVGGSIAGFSAAEALRSGGFDGVIRIVSEETVRTYERPPLSKGVLAGDDETSTEWHAAHSEDLRLDWFLGERAVGLDTGRGVVSLASGDDLAFDGLVIASGATPRRLANQPEIAGMHVLRSLDDSLGLRADLDAGVGRVVVIGAGFIGSEVAATCRNRGHDVTIVEPLEQPLVRVVGPTIGVAVADLHRRHGVDLRLGVGVSAIHGDDCVEGVQLTDGSVIEADVVVVGIGVVPNTGWLQGSGLPVADGVVADATCSVAPGVVACGDVARWASPRYGSIRIEHWDHAADMGRAAGRRLLVADPAAEPYDPVPWFWSDQHDVRIQVAGLVDGDMVVTDGSVESGKFVALYGRDGEVRGALGWNWPSKTVRYRMELEAGMAWSDAVG